MSNCSSPASHHSSYSIFSGAGTPETQITSPSLSREGSPKVANTYEYTANTTIPTDSDYYSSFFPDISSYPLDFILPEDPRFEFASSPLIPLDYFPEDANTILEDPNFDLTFFPDFGLSPPEQVVLGEPVLEPAPPVYSFWKAPPPPPSIETPINSGYPPASAFYGRLPGTFSDPPRPNFTDINYQYNKSWYPLDSSTADFSSSMALNYVPAVGAWSGCGWLVKSKGMWWEHRGIKPF